MDNYPPPPPSHQFRNFDERQPKQHGMHPPSNDSYYSITDESLNMHGGISSTPPYIGSKGANSRSTPINATAQRNLSMSSSTQRRNSMSSFETASSSVTTTTTTPLTQRAIATPFVNKPYKGLRHFSLMVCKKVEEKGSTSYNEVADELVRQIIDERNASSSGDAFDEKASSSTTIPTTPSPTKTTPSKFDEKNIRRRVYDALNVLMAMDIISKDKKAIMWQGLPTSIHSATSASIPKHSTPSSHLDHQPADHQEPPTEPVALPPDEHDFMIQTTQDPSTSLAFEKIKNDIEKRTKSIQKKRETIREILSQHVCFRNLVERNYQTAFNKKNDAISNDTNNESKNDSADTTNSTVSTSHRNKNKAKTHDIAKADSTNESNSTTALAGTKRKTPSPNSAPSTDTNQESKQDTAIGTIDLSKGDSAIDPRSSSAEKKQKEAEKKKQLLNNHKIPLPFIVINTNKNAVIQCNMSRDLTDVMFDFTMPFEINDDNSTLKRLQLHRTNHEVLRTMLPENIYDYCKKHDLFNNLDLHESTISPDDSIQTHHGNKGSMELAQ